MKLLTPYLTATGLLLTASAASAVTITSPVTKAVVTTSVSISGACDTSAKVKVNVRDANDLYTPTVSLTCSSKGLYSTSASITALANGTLRVKSYQSVNGATVAAYVYITKKAATSPTPTPTPKPTPTPTPVASSKIPLGVGGHEGLPAYPLASMEARFKFLSDNNLRIYRTGEVQIDSLDYANFDKLVAMAKKYNITLRPGLLKADQATAYAVAKRYANDIKVWEIGNELNLDPNNAAANIKKMVTTYKGIKQASDELGAGLKTTITVTACNTQNPNGTCYNVKEGDMWFLDQAKAAGFNFNYVGFHLYPYYGDKGFWFDMYLSQMKAMSTKYGAKVLFNELNCGEVYRGNTDGGGDCPLSLNDILTELNTKYKDVVQEINIYELMDEPTHAVTWEQHFGVLYDINNPKKSIDVIRSFAK